MPFSQTPALVGLAFRSIVLRLLNCYARCGHVLIGRGRHWHNVLCFLVYEILLLHRLWQYFFGKFSNLSTNPKKAIYVVHCL